MSTWSLSHDYAWLGERPAGPAATIGNGLFRPARAAIGLLCGAGVAGLCRFVTRDLAMGTMGSMDRNSHTTSQWLTMASSDRSAQHAPAHAFQPADGLDSVLVRPVGSSSVRSGAAGPLFGLPLGNVPETACLFAYGAMEQTMRQDADLLQGGTRSEEARIYGASLPKRNKLATPTGLAQDILSGWLLCWPPASFPSKLAAADALHAYDPWAPTRRALRRGLATVVTADNSTCAALWYFKHVDTASNELSLDMRSHTISNKQPADMISHAVSNKQREAHRSEQASVAPPSSNTHKPTAGGARADRITCGTCGAEIALPDHVVHALCEKMELDLTQQQQQAQDDLRTQLEALEQERQKMEQAQQELQAQWAAEKLGLQEDARKQAQAALREEMEADLTVKLAAQAKQLKAEAEREAKAGLAAELAGLEDQLQQRAQQLLEAKQLQSKLREEQERLRQAEAELQTQVAKKVAEEQAKWEAAAEQQAKDKLAQELASVQDKYVEQQRALEAALAARAQELEQERQATLQAQQELESQLSSRLAAQREQLKGELEREARTAQKGLAAELEGLKTELAERQQKLEQAQEYELELRQQQRAVEEKARQLELDMARQLDLERARLQEEARMQEAAMQGLRLADKDKLISDLQTQIGLLQQKAEQGSQQFQGEVQETVLEDLLREQFPSDEIQPVPTGVRGADLLQYVHNALGERCGLIIWESKRTKRWSQPWIAKLKDDARTQNADLAILVSKALPEGVAHCGSVDGVWVCNFAFVVPIATALRSSLLQVASARRAEAGKDEKMEVLYKYVTSLQFRRQVEGVLETFIEMKKDLDNERRSLERLWKKREMQLTRVVCGISGQYGSLQGIVGRAALPTIQSLELIEGAEFEDC
eukprot:g78051.t1